MFDTYLDMVAQPGRHIKLTITTREKNKIFSKIQGLQKLTSYRPFLGSVLESFSRTREWTKKEKPQIQEKAPTQANRGTTAMQQVEESTWACGSSRMALFRGKERKMFSGLFLWASLRVVIKGTDTGAILSGFKSWLPP